MAAELPKVDIFERLRQLPMRRFLDVQRNRINDLCAKLNGLGARGYGALRGGPAYFDQYPGKQIPRAFSKLYGPIGLQAPHTDTGGTGFIKLAPIVQPGTFILPRGTNILTGRGAAFYWVSTNVTGFCSWTYASNPGFSSPIDARAAGDIFDPVFGNNGGAQVLDCFGFVPVLDAASSPDFAPRICFHLDLYDRKRGRSLTNGPVPSELFCGGTFEQKRVVEGQQGARGFRFDIDTEIEPRVYIDEVRMNDALNTDAAFNAARVACYLNIEFKGYASLDEELGGAGVLR